MGIKDRNDGFTLIEMIVVITVMGILLGIMVPAGLQYIEKSKAKECEVNRRAILADLSADRIYEPGISLEKIIDKEKTKYQCPSGGDYCAEDKNTIICTIHGGNSAMSEEEESTSYPEVSHPVNPADIKEYTVVYYVESENGYNLYTKETYKEPVGSEVEATIISIEGFTYDKDIKGNMSKGRVLADGSLILKLYYKKIVEDVTYTVEFDPCKEGVKKPDSLTVKMDSLIGEPVLADTGEKPEGWYTEEEYSVKWNFTENKVTKNLTLYAKWKEEIPYTIKYYAQNLDDDKYTEIETKEKSGTEGEKVSVGHEVPPEGFELNLNKSVLEKILEKDSELELMVYYDRKLFKVEFISSILEDECKNAMPEKIEKIKYGATVSQPAAAPEAKNYDFTGWYAEENCKNIYNFNTLVTGNAKIYAGWKKRERYTVKFLLKGKGNSEDKEEVISSQQVEKGGKLDRPDDPVSKNGKKVFDGWYKNNGWKQEELWNFEKDTVNEDITLYGRFTNNTGDYMPVGEKLKFDCKGDLTEVVTKWFDNNPEKQTFLIEKGDVYWYKENYYIAKVPVNIDRKEGSDFNFSDRGEIVLIDNKQSYPITDYVRYIEYDYRVTKDLKKGSVVQFEGECYKILIKDLNKGEYANQSIYNGTDEGIWVTVPLKPHNGK